MKASQRVPKMGAIKLLLYAGEVAPVHQVSLKTWSSDGQ